MTYQQKIKFIELNNKIIDYLKENGFNTFYNDDLRVKDLFIDAKRINKTNNSLLKLEDYDSVLRLLSGYCLKTERLIYFNLYPNKENTIEKIFIYLVLESQYANKQCYEYFKLKSTL